MQKITNDNLDKAKKFNYRIVDIVFPVSVISIFYYFTSLPKAFFTACLAAMLLIVVQENKILLKNVKFYTLLAFVALINLFVIYSFDYGEDLKYNLIYAQVFLIQGIILHYTGSKLK